MNQMKKFTVAVLSLVVLYAAFMAVSYLIIANEFRKQFDAHPFRYLYSDAGYIPDDTVHRTYCSQSLLSIRPDKLLVQNILVQARVLTWSGEVPLHFGALVSGDGVYYWSFHNWGFRKASDSTGVVEFRDFRDRGYRC